MAYMIAVAGKGGTGKTSLCALLIRALSAKKTSIMAVDADPNLNLNEALGVTLNDTIGNIRQEALKNQGVGLPGGMTKQQHLTYKIEQSMAEADGYDLIAMGQPEGNGCYCFANHIIKDYLDKIADDYKYIVLDNEAGLEHLARRTTHNADVLLTVSDPSVRSIRSAGRVKKLVEEISLSVKEIYLVINRLDGELSAAAQEEIEKTGLKVIGQIPQDQTLAAYDGDAKPLISLPDNSPAVTAAAEILEKIL